MYNEDILRLDEELKKYLAKFKPQVFVKNNRIFVVVENETYSRPLNFGTISTSVFSLGSR